MIQISQEQLDHINLQLSKLTPQEIIKWSYITFPNLFQISAFGLTGLITIDIINKLELPIELVFIDTLYHFPQTLELVDKIKSKYNPKLHIFKPQVKDVTEFESKYGNNLWETDDLKYDFLVKVEPLKRAYEELKINAVLTGRRSSQGGARSGLEFIEIDRDNNVIKVNPFLTWNFNQVKSYIDENNVPYNELLDLGYKSIGDWHSTEPVGENEDERSGRWKGKAKTECGIHQTSKYAEFLKSQ